MLTDEVSLAMAEVPGLPEPTVSGHGGRFVFGRLASVDVLLQAGRYHAYEGYGLDIVSAPMRVLSAMGIETVVMTSAVGALDPSLGVGDLVLLDDQINLSFRAPLQGPVVEGEDRFPDMSSPFDAALQHVALEAASSLGIELRRGTYAGVLGPAYETRAEVAVLRMLGGDIVGMSTVPEVIAAHAAGLRCVAVSLVTNKATGLAPVRISHEDVLVEGEEASERFARLIVELVRRHSSGESHTVGESYSVDAK
jgi:purine-nucleoside phosphorylase